MYRAAMDDWRSSQRNQLKLITSYKNEGLWDGMPPEAKAALWQQPEQPNRLDHVTDDF